MRIGLIPVDLGHRSVEPMIEIAQTAEEVGISQL